ncbi:histidine--tRNA ligase [Acetobacter sp. AN02]|uniref:histidine--tRNA ligase n=1 Tax=Acetobacter sp. AN02 TaxID=2894186 RepID=UPI0024345804|nr:histidine--tRNA ligase [Acetobacter sp. AN02]MDG6093761.1 histidine--tRNA ligase [Acetobacter sp. AN02]
MSMIQPVRGTHDLIGEGQKKHAHVVDTARRITSLYGFDEWQTPVFEDTGVFARTLGDTSDIVSKEMYTFTDRGGDSLTLRPEGTAGICRALITNGLTQTLPQRVFYTGPMFRYERPQKGRYRQFHQIGSELIGPSEPMADAEIIRMGYDILIALGLEKDVELELNTLGDPESRQIWRDRLVAYFTPLRDRLSEDSRTRLEKNPLRILDSKAPEDRELLADAPDFASCLNETSRAFWDDLRRSLDAFGVPFRENPMIVRGLDYYSHTAFEFVTTRLGAQGTVLAGGRYEGLIAEMGGPKTPAVGWGAGIERLSMLLENFTHAERTVAIIPTSDTMQGAAVDMLSHLRGAGIRCEMAYRGNMKKRLERANKSGAVRALILGEEEFARGVIRLKNLENGSQTDLSADSIIAQLVQEAAGTSA